MIKYCVDCNACLGEVHGLRKRCEECAQNREKRLAREGYLKRKKARLAREGHHKREKTKKTYGGFRSPLLKKLGRMKSSFDR